MPRETKYAGIAGELQRLLGALEANREELPQLEPFRLKLVGIFTQVLEVFQQQAALKASKQESSKRLRQLLGEGQRVATVARVAIKEHYGVREEKVVEFGLQPFRGRKTPTLPEAPALSN